MNKFDFNKVKLDLNRHALLWHEKKKASLPQGGLNAKPSSSAQTAA
jgi:hypothetical protein